MRSNLGVVASAHVAGGFSPDSVTGMLAWWDASDASTFTYSSGTVVATWDDKSSAGRDLTTASGSPSRSTTIGGLDAVALSGGYLQTADPGSAMSAPVSMMAAVKSEGDTGAGASKVFVGSRVGGTSLAFYTSSSAFRIYAGTARGGGAVANNTEYTTQWLYNGASNGEVRVNGGTNTLATGSQGTNGPRGFQVGALAGGSAGAHIIGEICLYSTALSLADMNAIGDYLSAKWGTTWSTAT